MSDSDTKKASLLWLILPIILFLVGGVIAYIALRKKDKRLGEICLVLGVGFTLLWWILNSYTNLFNDVLYPSF